MHRLWPRLALLTLMAFGTGSSCQPDDAPLLPADTRTPAANGATLIARFVHITDTHIVDACSPARFAGADKLVDYAWRPWENCSTQILDGVVRTANRIHAGGQPVQFAILTGDNCDNLQKNELDWFLRLMDGGTVHPLSGPDDRSAADIPDSSLDPYAPFSAEGLYQQGVHGALPSIPWYAMLGNHDEYAIGVFPVIPEDGRLVGLLPLPVRPGVWLPRVLDPIASFAYGVITPAFPGPPAFLNSPAAIEPKADRAYFTQGEFFARLQRTRTSPAGHGFSPDGPPWYSVSPLPGVRLLGLFTSQQPNPIPEFSNDQGCMLADQIDWLRSELQAATARGELVIVASHHPSGSLEPLYGSAIDPEGFRALLNAYPVVVLHLAGHNHWHRAVERGNYLEIETASTIDWPQQARLLELWRDPDGTISIGYDVFSGVDARWPSPTDDTLVELRTQARDLAFLDLQKSRSLAGQDGDPQDAKGLVRLPPR